MVTLRRSKTKQKKEVEERQTVGDNGNQPSPSTPAPVPASVKDGIDYAAKYREAHYKEKEAERKTILHRLLCKLKLLWFQVCISLGPFMLDPWEQFLYFSSLLALLWLLVMAILRLPVYPWLLEVTNTMRSTIEGRLKS